MIPVWLLISCLLFMVLHLIEDDYIILFGKVESMMEMV